MAINNLFSVFDGHNDTLTRLDGLRGGKQRSFFVENEDGHIDLPRARRGGFAGGFFAIFEGGIPVAQELGDVAGLPKLMGVLREHGYDDGSLHKLTHENWLRVLRRTWR